MVIYISNRLMQKKEITWFYLHKGEKGKGLIKDVSKFPFFSCRDGGVEGRSVRVVQTILSRERERECGGGMSIQIYTIYKNKSEWASKRVSEREKERGYWP